MRVLAIGTDREIFTNDSPVRKRQVSYATHFDEYYIIIYSLKEDNLPKIMKLSDNCWAISTGSKGKLSYIEDAIAIGKKMDGIDWVSGQDPFESGWAAMKLARDLKAKLNIQIHTDFNNRHYKYANLLNFIRVWMAARILPKADSIRVVSERIKKSIIKDFQIKAPVSVLPVYTDTDNLDKTEITVDLHKKFPKFKKIILSVGRISPEKNLSLALDVFKEVSEERQDVGYIIVGGSRKREDLKEDLLKKISKLGLEDKVIILDWQTDIASYIKTSDVYLSTSKYEGYGLSLVEASLLGTPVVSTDVGVAGDLLMNHINALICPVGNKKCLADSVLKLLQDKELYQEIKKNARKIAKNFVSKSEYEYLEKYRRAILGQK